MRRPKPRQPAALALIIFLLAAPPLRSYSFNDSKSPDALRVLFIGNSLTYSNDLPAIVQAMGAATLQRPLVYKTIAFPNFSLEDHWNQKEARKAIANSAWDIVVMQQGPSASTEGRALLLEYARRFADEIRRAGGRPALYIAWPFA